MCQPPPGRQTLDQDDPGEGCGGAVPGGDHCVPVPGQVLGAGVEADGELEIQEHLDRELSWSASHTSGKLTLKTGARTIFRITLNNQKSGSRRQQRRKHVARVP